MKLIINDKVFVFDNIKSEIEQDLVNNIIHFANESNDLIELLKGLHTCLEVYEAQIQIISEQ
jgi:hypothetical protein